MKHSLLLGHLMASLTISATRGSIDCGWQNPSNSLCGPDNCCNLVGQCGTGSSCENHPFLVCGSNACQTGSCAIDPPIGTYDYCENQSITNRVDVMANLDLTVGSLYRTEYESFTLLEMYVNGNPTTNKPYVANAYIAYDCQNKILCLATHLLANTTNNDEYYKIEQSQGEAWVRFGPDINAPKLVVGNTDPSDGETSSYIFKPNPDSGEAIGFEGCWDFNMFATPIPPVTNDIVNIHMNSEP
eukprot:scaffold31371_cov59-Cyclotella_meneghiniana.AAC.1